jgi:BlaI family penicillinase repressor
MDKYLELSANDSKIMELVWKLGEVNNASILKELESEPNWTRHTVKTYLKRLTDKGLLELKQISPRKFKYYPLVTKEEYLAEEASAYLHDHFNGLTHMVAGLIDNEKISDEEIESLESYIKTLKEKKQR